MTGWWTVKKSETISGRGKTIWGKHQGFEITWHIPEQQCR